jgi:hypothetical protein
MADARDELRAMIQDGMPPHRKRNRQPKGGTGRNGIAEGTVRVPADQYQMPVGTVHRERPDEDRFAERW